MGIFRIKASRIVDDWVYYFYKVINGTTHIKQNTTAEWQVGEIPNNAEII